MFLKQARKDKNIMEHYSDRIEIKYVLNEQQYQKTKGFLDEFGVLDKHITNNEGYRINTYYIASWKSSTRTNKNHGKLRIRSYLDSEKIYLEEKSRIRNRYYKKRILINNQDKELLKSFNKISQIDYFSQNKNFILSVPFCFISDFDKFEIDYFRIAYLISYNGLNFRATIDSELKSLGENLLDKHYILEIKTHYNFENTTDLFLKKFGLLPYKISKHSLLKKKYFA